MAVTGVLRPGYVQMRVLDMEQAIPHYRDRVGLDQVGETEGDRAFFRGFDEFDRHSIILREADTPGLDVIGFKVASDRDLDVFKPASIRLTPLAFTACRTRQCPEEGHG